MFNRSQEDVNKRGQIIPFETRSQKLARDLMKAVGLKKGIIESFESGQIVRTNCKNVLSITQENITENDMKIISDLETNGLLVYHVLVSDIMIGIKTEIQCEHEVSTYENIISTISYLCVPSDIFTEAMSYENDVTNEGSRESVIKEYIEHNILMANQGYLNAYVLNNDDSADFYNIGVNVFNGNLIRVS